MELPPAPVQPSGQPTARPTMDELLAAGANGGPWDPETFLQLLLQFFVAEKLPWREVGCTLTARTLASNTRP